MHINIKSFCSIQFYMNNIFDYEINLSGITNLINDYFGKFLQPTQIKTLSSLVLEQLEEDAKFIASRDPSQNSVELVKSNKTKGVVATMCYRVANNLLKRGIVSETVARNFMEMVAVNTSIDIHPLAQIDIGFFIDHGVNVVIGSTCVIGKHCNLFNDVVLGSKNVINPQTGKRHPTLKDNVTICAGAKILGDITIGNNCFVSPQAVVLEDVPDNTHVSIVNQLQISKKINCLPSQKMVVYAVVPKYKNILKILGEGFYNPTVLIKLKNDKTLNYAITYWDKNKILIKIKNTTPFNLHSTHGAKIIILSNADKVVVTQSYGLTKLLTNLN